MSLPPAPLCPAPSLRSAAFIRSHRVAMPASAFLPALVNRDRGPHVVSPASLRVVPQSYEPVEVAMYHARQTMLNVEESDRLSFLPDLFGNDFLAGEMQVYALAEKHITDYCGGFWHFIRIPEGGGYMMPDGDRFHLTNPDNWFDRSVSADAAGVIITALAINRRIWLHHERGDAALTRHLMLRESQLWNFIDSHDECAAIYAALD